MDSDLISIKIDYEGKIYKYLVSPDDTIDELKEALAKELDFDRKDDFFLTDGKSEMKKFKLRSYSIKNGSTIRVFPIHITGGIVLVKLPKDKFKETSRCRHLADTHEDFYFRRGATFGGLKNEINNRISECRKDLQEIYATKITRLPPNTKLLTNKPKRTLIGKQRQMYDNAEIFSKDDGYSNLVSLKMSK